MKPNNRVYDSFEDYPQEQWYWPNFTPAEMASRGDGKLAVDWDAMDKLQALRTKLGKPLFINSAYRSPEHNERVGGAPKSMHLKAKAFDVQMDNQDPVLFEAAAREVGFTSFGYYQKSRFMHIDTRDKPTTWGDPWADDAQKADETADHSAPHPPRPVRKKRRFRT